MEKHVNRINRIAIVSGIATIITVVTFFYKGFGNMAIADNKLTDVVEWKKDHTKEHILNDKLVGEALVRIEQKVTDIKEDVDRIK
jgi:hypothetical protein